MNSSKWPAVVLIAFFFLLSFTVYQFKPLRAHMQTKRLFNGSYIRIEADIIYNPASGSLVSHYTYPEEYYFITNKFGEAKVYFPAKNEVMVKNHEILSSENNLFFYFATNRSFDFGLNDLGFKMANSEKKDMLVKTSWTPPLNMAKFLTKVEIVYNEYLPVYAAYYSNKGQIFKKIYYSNYTDYPEYSIPLRVTEINYQATGDSTIAVMTLSEINFEDTDLELLNFKIPDNAKIIE